VRGEVRRPAGEHDAESRLARGIPGRLVTLEGKSERLENQAERFHQSESELRFWAWRAAARSEFTLARGAESCAPTRSFPPDARKLKWKMCCQSTVHTVVLLLLVLACFLLVLWVAGAFN
jgi:hypothetical protein